MWGVKGGQGAGETEREAEPGAMPLWSRLQGGKDPVSDAFLTRDSCPWTAGARGGRGPAANLVQPRFISFFLWLPWVFLEACRIFSCGIVNS